MLHTFIHPKNASYSHVIKLSLYLGVHLSYISPWYKAAFVTIDILTHAPAIIFDDKVSGIAYSDMARYFFIWTALYGYASAGSC